MLVTVTWPANAPSTVTANGSARCSRACLRRSRTRLRKVRGAVVVPRRDRRLPRLQPRGVASAYLGPGAGVARRTSGRSPTRPSVSTTCQGSAGCGSVVAPDDLLDRVHQQRAQHRETVLDAAARPGQVDHQRLATDAGEPAGQRGRRDAVRDAVRPDRLRDARDLTVQQRRG